MIEGAFSYTIRIAGAVVICALLQGCARENETDAPGPAQAILLELLDPEHTGVDFNNALNDEGNLNVFIWNFLYTGAGVAVGDINNDGLPDLYFAGNQAPDRLYLNKGDYVFEDITEQAGIVDNLWSTGVTMADVNGDGLLDIYVCKNSPTTNREANRNKLYINLGNGRFSEQAVAYGLADEGFSIQAMFFDADQDGDLDMYLLNQPFDQFAQLIHPPEVVETYPSTDRFFENIDGRFVDRTEAMGMVNARYGLGISLGDFDGNGWTDMYVCNDYIHADHLYMNVGGAFTDQLRERINHISFYSMGSDAGDINNDGWEDIIVLDMAYEDHYRAKTNMESMQPQRFWDLVADGQHYQYAQNTLLLNKGDGYFVDIAQLSGVAKTDWSWAALFADLDHDGLQDLIVTNGIMRDMMDNDFADWVRATYQGRVGPHNYLEVLSRLPSHPVTNKLYRNRDGMRFDDITEAAGFFQPGFSHGLAYADLNNNGKLDLVVNNMNAPAAIYRNVTPSRGQYFKLSIKGPGSNHHGLGIPVLLCTDGYCTARTMQTTRGYYSSCPPELHFGTGNAQKIDSLFIYWNSREMTVLRDLGVDQHLTVDYAQSGVVPWRARASSQIITAESSALPHRHQEIPFDDYRDQVLLPYKLSQNGPYLAQADTDGDGAAELFAGGAAGQPGVIMKRQRDGSYVVTDQPALRADAAHEDMQAVFFDINGNGFKDLYVVSGSNEFRQGDPLLEDRVYINDGRGRFTRSAEVLPDGLRINGQTAVVIDINGDGWDDLFIGGRLIAGHYPLPPSSAILINTQGILSDRTAELAPCLRQLGLVTAAVVDDLDGDGAPDILVVGEWMPPTMLINRDGMLECIPLEDPGPGLWWSIAKGDFDGDGDHDFILGNLGWNHKFGGSGPAKLAVYAGDHDGDGTHDILLTKPHLGRELPYRGRECTSEEMPYIARKFPTYHDFASAFMDEILTPQQMAAAAYYAINTLSSVYLRNDGNLQFTVVELPVEVQTGPVRAILPLDVDGDGHLDFIYAGNHFPVEVETARYDGLMHGVAFGDGTGGFTVRTLASMGHPVTCDYRDIVRISPTGGGAVQFILAQNDGPVVKYRLSPDVHENRLIQ